MLLVRSLFIGQLTTTNIRFVASEEQAVEEVLDSNRLNGVAVKETTSTYLGSCIAGQHFLPTLIIHQITEKQRIKLLLL